MHDRICVSAINLGALGAAQERDAVLWRTMLEHQSDLVWSLPKLRASRTELTEFPNFDTKPKMW